MNWHWKPLAPPTSHQCDPNASPTPLHWVHWVQQDLSNDSNCGDVKIGFVGDLTYKTYILAWCMCSLFFVGMAFYGNVELTLRLQHFPNNEEMPLASSSKQFLRVQPTGMIWNENSGVLDRFENKFDCKHVHTFSQTSRTQLSPRTLLAMSPSMYSSDEPRLHTLTHLLTPSHVSLFDICAPFKSDSTCLLAKKIPHHL